MEAEKRVTVIGAGTMGHGIAQVAAQSGMEVVLYDVAAELLEKAMDAIRSNLGRGVEKGKVTPAERHAALGKVRPETDLDAAVEGTTLVIEAVPEDLDLKKQIFGDLDARVSPDAVLATNTSSLPIGDIAAVVGNPERVVGMHFFNPVHIMALLEVVRAEITSSETVERAVEAGTQMGKECIVVRDSPGFARRSACWSRAWPRPRTSTRP
jgi:3-hydroxybutyryl-CoA dehydrogenase